MAEVEEIKRRCELLAPHLDEWTRRLWAASEAVAIGRGGATVVARATGVSRRVIGEGIKELTEAAPRSLGPGGAVRIRRPGGGRKRMTDTDPTLGGNPAPDHRRWWRQYRFTRAAVEAGAAAAGR